jgi:hypothetical protein
LKADDKRYGLMGWREFHNTRKEILNEFNRSKGYNINRPVRTEHGNAGEAALRKWFSAYLPKKYGVTSGYIIPDIMTTEYKLYHFDLLIYDQINAPILWIDGDYDHSDQGKKRAIPAKHVKAAFEIKASLTRKSASDTINKLCEFNKLKENLPSSFSCGAIFIDIDAILANQQNILPKLIPSSPIIGYWGGLVLHCSIDEEMTGLIELIDFPKDKEQAKNLNIPIVKDIEALNIYRNEDGKVTIAEQGAGVMAFAGPDEKWHFSKQYGPIIYGELFGLMLAWSHNGFARFALDLLSRLDGILPNQNRQYIFGQVFDKVVNRNKMPNKANSAAVKKLRG